MNDDLAGIWKKSRMLKVVWVINIILHLASSNIQGKNSQEA
jgi:hypothetical protein